jgi:parallel beta helix pectate lyase-like protein
VTRSPRLHPRPALAALLLAALPATSLALTLHVGPNKSYATVRAAAEAALPGDVVLIDAGIYSADVATWKADNVTVRAVGGRAHLRADGAQEGGKAIWVVQGRNFSAEGIEFSGAKVPDGNGAGIRSETPGTLILRDCYFHDNEDGILGGADSMVIENCVFDRNGAGDGRTHNIYASGRSFTLRGSTTKRAIIGHNVKTRAKNNYILYNRIQDEASGTASYEVDVPDCGRTYLIGNVIEQGPKSENATIISYGAESATNVQDLYVVNNTIVNDRAEGTFLQIRQGTKALVWNNIFYGPGTPWVGGTVTQSRNYVDSSLGNGPGFADPRTFDYRLTAASSPEVVDAGAPPGRSITGFDLTPASQCGEDARTRARTPAGALDIGAFEREPESAAKP